MTTNIKDLEKRIDYLYETILKLKTKEDCKAFFADLCTFKEIEQMAQRAYGAKLFLENKTYSQIISETEISSATLSRISRSISHGSGGYTKFLEIEKEGE